MDSDADAFKKKRLTHITRYLPLINLWVIRVHSCFFRGKIQRIVSHGNIKHPLSRELRPPGQQAAAQVVKLNMNHLNSSPKLGVVDAQSADGGVCTASPETHAPVAACGGATPSSLEGELRIDYSSLQFSRGSLAAPAAPQYAVDEGGVLTVRWSAEGGSLTDRVHIYIYSPAAQTGIALQGERGRHGLQALLPQDFAGEELNLWAFASNASGNVSNTQYINPIDSIGEKNDIVNAEATHNVVPAAGPGSDCTQFATPPSGAAAVGDG